ncbi:MAG: hypothetical protein ACRDCE_10495, partial [Cetobacterium sp.]|uniref:hypothetical protein n=1 Tax=Cetobacterium sp. TaxID=2071632 RepID=UPI003EE68855
VSGDSSPHFRGIKMYLKKALELAVELGGVILDENYIDINGRLYVYEDCAEFNDVTFMPNDYDENNDDVLVLLYEEIQTTDEEKIKSIMRNYFMIRE